MFNKDFYPTPEGVIKTMLENELIAGSVILEPSAGKGNIVKMLKEYGALEVLTCEIIKEFQPYLKETSKFLKPDFLTVKPEEISHVGFIIMNPPFSKAIEHIEHAYNIAPPGCTIISLCNETNIKPEEHYFRRYSDDEIEEIKRKNKRKEKLIHLVENHGFYTSLYDCFTEAERKTGVNVAKVVLFKDGKEDEIDFGAYMDFTFDEHSSQSGIMPYNEVRECVNRYVGAVNKYTEMQQAISAMNSLVEPFDAYGNTQISVTIKNERSNLSFSDYKKQLQKAAWQWIFRKLNMQKYQTKKLEEQMNRYIELKCKYPFTIKNIYNVLDMIVQTHGQRMESTLVEAFDLICSYSADNKIQYEGWKTNSAYKVNKRFIIPYICKGYKWCGKEAEPYVTLNDGYARDVNDIYKALCHLTGTDYNTITTPLSLTYRTNYCEWGKWYQCGFFRIRGYKKGTMHFEFTDDKVWERFNRRVAEIKGWELPEKTDNKTKGTERTKKSGVEVYNPETTSNQQQKESTHHQEQEPVVAIVTNTLPAVITAQNNTETHHENTATDVEVITVTETVTATKTRNQKPVITNQQQATSNPQHQKRILWSN